jgi:arylsulfatase
MRPGWRLSAKVLVTAGNMNGPLYVQGDQFGGAALMLKEGRVTFLYNPTGGEAQRVTLTSGQVLTPGAHRLEAISAPAPGSPRSASWTLRVDGVDQGSATVKTLYPILWGNTYFGRPGLGRVLRDEAPVALTGGTLETAEIRVP